VLIRVFRGSTVTAVAAGRTDRSGRFVIPLPPGRYVLRVDVPDAKDQPLALRVRPAAWSAVTLHYLVAPYME
jgi:hypothetical protein